MNTTAAQDAARIRSVLKKQGISQRQVSIRSESGSISIQIHDPAVDIREVRNVAASSEKVDRDAYTGEILCGGNRFLHVSYSDKAAEVFADQVADLIAAIISSAEHCTESSSKSVGEWSLWRNVMGAGSYILTRRENRLHRYLYNLDPAGIALAMLESREM